MTSVYGVMLTRDLGPEYKVFWKILQSIFLYHKSKFGFYDI